MAQKHNAQTNETPSGRGGGLQDSQQNRRAGITPPARFSGTDNLRHLRAIAALLRRPVPREQLDRLAGTSNSPELVAELRPGLEVPCERIRFIDRNGCACRPGVYSLSLGDCRMVYAWMARRGGAAHA